MECECSESLVSYPSLPSQHFSQPWKKSIFSTAVSCEERPGYEASESLLLVGLRQHLQWNKTCNDGIHTRNCSQ